MENQQAPKATFRRKQFLVDKGFQLKYTVVVVLIGVLIAGIWGAMFVKANRENSEQFIMSIKVDPEHQAIADKIDEKLQGEDVEKLYYLGAFMLGLAVILALWGVVVTHRVAGPIYIISRYVDQIASGRYPDPRPLRKKDELKEFFIHFNEMLKAIKDRESSDIESLGKTLQAIKKAQCGQTGELAKVASELEILKATKEAMLDGDMSSSKG